SASPPRVALQRAPAGAWRLDEGCHPRARSLRRRTERASTVPTVGDVQRPEHRSRVDVSVRRSAAAGATAALAWAALEPLDRRVFRCDYSDVALLGNAVMPRRGWLPLGLALHALNGAAFGLGYELLRARTPYDPRRLAVGLALIEHVTLYPLGHFVDRFHPRRGEPGIPPLVANPRAFAQATVRHAAFRCLLAPPPPHPRRPPRPTLTSAPPPAGVGCLSLGGTVSASAGRGCADSATILRSGSPRDAGRRRPMRRTRRAAATGAEALARRTCRERRGCGVRRSPNPRTRVV